MHFKIIIVGGAPCEPYLDKCIQYVNQQTYTDWECIVWLDPFKAASDLATKLQSKKIKFKINNVWQGALFNIVHAIRLINPKEDDIIILIDGDDYLINKDALKVILSYYKRNDILATHGSFIYENGKKGEYCEPYTTFEFNHLRSASWKFCSPKTFKFKLWKHLSHHDLEDDTGHYAKIGWDLSLLSLLEMAGIDRVQWISDILYQYNKHHLNDDKKNRIEQIRIENYFRGMKPKQRIEKL